MKGLTYITLDVKSIRVLANGGILPGIFLGISVGMVLAGLREGHP